MAAPGVDQLPHGMAEKHQQVIALVQASCLATLSFDAAGPLNLRGSSASHKTLAKAITE